MKKKIILSVLAVLVICAVVRIIVVNNTTPEEALRRTWSAETAARYEVVEETDIGKGFCMVVRKNKNLPNENDPDNVSITDNVSIAVMKKGLFRYTISFGCPMGVPYIDADNSDSAYIFYTGRYRKTVWVSLAYIQTMMSRGLL